MSEEECGVLIRADFGQRAAIQERTDLLYPCQHEQPVVDEANRTVECGACGAPLDAFTVLLQYARKERHWRNWQAEVGRCHNELEKLKDEERNESAHTVSVAQGSRGGRGRRARPRRARAHRHLRRRPRHHRALPPHPADRAEKEDRLTQRQPSERIELHVESLEEAPEAVARAQHARRDEKAADDPDWLHLRLSPGDGARLKRILVHLLDGAERQEGEGYTRAGAARFAFRKCVEQLETAVG